jgi:hypothetical protein
LTTALSTSGDSKLSISVTVSQYRKFEKEQNRSEIIKFIRERFTERYISPLKTETKHGFCTMAVCCLMIEALESFWRGWPNSNGKSELAFCSFFSRSEELKDFRAHSQEFYKHVRCGILHQAETTGGWHILRKGFLFDSETKTINATRFHGKLEQCLGTYCDALGKAAWNDEIWRNLRKKMDAVCKNCAA